MSSQESSCGAASQGAAGAAAARRDPAIETEPRSAAKVDWTELVERVRAGEPRGMEELYRIFSRGVRFYFCRHLGPQELDDRVHDAFLIVVQAIQRGDLREPERLMGFVRTVVRRQVAGYIDQAVHVRRDFQDIEASGPVSDDGQTPEESLMAQQRSEIMEAVLRSVSSRDREILTRFYLLEQSQEQICSEMKLTETQFRLLKSRAKARFGQLGRRKLHKRPLVQNWVRKMAGFQH